MVPAGPMRVPTPMMVPADTSFAVGNAVDAAILVFIIVG
jgi:hypothetical protein